MFLRKLNDDDDVRLYIDKNPSSGAHLVSWDRSGNLNQCFDFHFVGAPPHEFQPSFEASKMRYAAPAPPAPPAPQPRYDIGLWGGARAGVRSTPGMF